MKELRVALVLLALIANGCAFGTRRVNLTYGPSLSQRDHQPTHGAVAVARLRDGRIASQGTGELLGKVRNGYGAPTASVVANQDPVLWVSEGIVRGLRNEGLAVRRVESPADAEGLPTVTGTLTRASGGMYMSMDANISADISVERQGSPLASVHCDGRASKVAWTVSAEEYRGLFEAAMTDFVGHCVPQLLPTLKQSSPKQ